MATSCVRDGLWSRKKQAIHTCPIINEHFKQIFTLRMKEMFVQKHLRHLKCHARRTRDHSQVLLHVTSLSFQNKALFVILFLIIKIIYTGEDQGY